MKLIANIGRWALPRLWVFLAAWTLVSLVSSVFSGGFGTNYGAFAVAAGRGGTTRLYRAVLGDELSDIAERQAFRNPSGIESKYFSTSAEGAASYARQAAHAFGEGPFTIIETSIASNLITRQMRVTVDRGVSTVVLPTRLLPSLGARTLGRLRG